MSGLTPVIGLENLGNTCYLNSLLQGLVCIPQFVCWIQQARTSVCQPRLLPLKEKNPLDLDSMPRFERRSGIPRAENAARSFFHSFCRTFDALSPKRVGVARSYAASSLLNSTFSGSGSSSRNFQQDPDELFLFVSDLIRSALLHQRRSLFQISPERDLFSDESSGDGGEKPQRQQPDVGCRTIRSFRSAEEVLTNSSSTFPFHGMCYEELYCVVCKKARPLPLEVFTSLSLTFPYGRQRTQAYFLEDLLRSYFTPADLDSVECPHCSKRNPNVAVCQTPHLKRIALARMPKVLCIHIRRAVWDGGDSWKRPDVVSFGANLFMNEFSWFKYVTEPSEGKSTLISPKSQFPVNPTGVYSLHSVIVHVGSQSSGGHIVAYRKGPVSSKNASQWYYTSDDFVRRVDWSEVESANPYMLFYQRI